MPYQAFNSTEHRDKISWNTMIQAYSNHGQVKEALKLLEEMSSFEIVPDEYTYCIVLKAFAETSNLHEGQAIHNMLKVYKFNDHYHTYLIRDDMSNWFTFQ